MHAKVHKQQTPSCIVVLGQDDRSLSAVGQKQTAPVPRQPSRDQTESPAWLSRSTVRCSTVEPTKIISSSGLASCHPGSCSGRAWCAERSRAPILPRVDASAESHSITPHRSTHKSPAVHEQDGVYTWVKIKCKSRGKTGSELSANQKPRGPAQDGQSYAEA